MFTINIIQPKEHFPFPVRYHVYPRHTGWLRNGLNYFFVAPQLTCCSPLLYEDWGNSLTDKYLKPWANETKTI